MNEPDQRPSKPAILRGLAWKCPACGTGSLFSRYLKVVPDCAHCGEDLSHQRADDGPPYVTMLIICHIAGLMIHKMVVHTELSPPAMALIVFAVVIPMALMMLPSVKGFFVAIQWSRRMHGFGRNGAHRS